MPTETPPCARCHRRGLSCVLHTASLRNGNVASAADHRQLNLLGDDMANIYATLQAVCGRLDLPQPQPLRFSPSTATTLDVGPGNANSQSNSNEAEDVEVYELSAPASPSGLQAPIHPYLSSTHDHLPQHATLPGSSGSTSHANQRPDLVTKGLVSLDLTERLVQRYLKHFDRFLYGIARHYHNATEVRKASSTLLAAMCAVCTFHDLEQKDLFAVCYREYRALVSASLFEKRSIEYLRALCIGTFWLLDSSRILLSDAVRRSADCRLHSHFRRLPIASTQLQGTFSMSPPSVATAGATTTDRSMSGEKLGESKDDDARDKMRLWYLLFISDRHLTILHNRDSLIWQEKEAIDGRDLFLANHQHGGVPAETSNLDVRLMSQVSLLVIMGHIRDVLGGREQGGPVPKSFTVQFSHFAQEIDQWYTKFLPSFGKSPVSGLRK